MAEKTKLTIAIIAAQYGVSAEKVEHDMMETIRIAIATTDLHAQALWKQVFPDGINRTWIRSSHLRQIE